jgi:ubiquinone/menaquinone biosynthesis C-methylase UbiE
MGNGTETHPQYGVGSLKTDRISDAARSTNTAVERDALTERSRRVWSAGDYDRIAAGFRDGAQAFVERLSLVPGQLVLDAAAGSGNLTIPAARTGAVVTGIDLVPSLLSAALHWAAREGLAIALDLGNVEELPYEGARFDVVMSMFGVMFAARPDQVVAELARVTRPGGRVVLANWTRRGFIGQLLAKHAAVAPPPAGVPSPLLWSDETVLRERFDDRTWQLTTTTRTLMFRYPHTPAGTAELFRAAYGPTVSAFAVLDENRRATFAADLAAHWSWHQRGTDASTEVDAEYLEVVAVRR